MRLLSIWLSLILLASFFPEGAKGVSPTEWLAQAQAHEAAQEFGQAAAAYRQYLASRPEDDEVRASLARVLSWEGHYQEAVQLYQEILSRHPVDYDIRVALARVKSWQKQFEEAMALYEGVLQEVPTNREAKRGLADTLYWSGDYRQALDLYEALATEVQNPEIEKRIQAVKAELARESPRQLAGRHIEPALPFRNYFKIGYGHFFYTGELPDERNGLLEIARPIGKQTFVGRVEILNRFGFIDAPLSGELYSPLWDKAWGYIGASAAADPDFVARWTVGGEIFQGLGVLHPKVAFLEPSFGYRRMSFRSVNVDLLIPGLTIYFPSNIWLTEKVYYVPETGSITLASQLTWRPTPRIQVFASGGFGTSGERIEAIQDFTRVSSRTIQGGLVVPLVQRVSLEVLGFYEDRETLFVRRGGRLNLLLHW